MTFTKNLSLSKSICKTNIEVLMKKLTLLLLFTSLFIPSTATSGMAEIDGNMLLDNCKEAVRYMENKNAPSINFSSVNFCMGFISGVNQLHTAFVSSVSCFDPPMFCGPPPANSEDLIKMVVKFLKTNPQDLHFQGSVLTIAALKEAFPCP